ncbi:Malic enzyme, NAD binding domain protein [Synechococcus sp. PCC 7335]|uniref:NAD-dependent malic enzyme n=1 Tax=Synechococcus sp. (strain ATCC 29403 / PCC 7335) TaxID=91464 RepID=UPI00017EDC7B|nr:NAD-dependent malic enzyme [Synechococcus sp. PCC 7335]EDX84469.1 Malic enzyme, NAD binding domain protein [Synechococcus sp. PCC 7335]
MVSLTPNPSYSLTLRIKLPNQVGALTKVIEAIACSGGSLGNIDIVEKSREYTVRDVSADASGTAAAAAIEKAVRSLSDIEVLNTYDRTFALHKGGKLRVEAKIPLREQDDLAMAYTPGVGRVCVEIANNPESVYDYTIKGNTVAIVSDGSAVLGLGNLGAAGSMPVMEGKAMLFKEFSGLDAFPICLDTQDTEEIIETVKRIAPVFGAINLEDISAPRCFEIEKRLQADLDIPVFHDDQHGTAIVSLAALINSLKLVKKNISEIRLVINGAGAAGLSMGRLFKRAGLQELIICDSKGIISRDRTDLSAAKKEFAVDKFGTLADAMKGADVFMGVSAPGVVTVEMVKSMAADPIVFAMANPIPEIQPELIEGIVAVVATGRSDYPNQINNVLAFPGVIRGALDCRAKEITTEMFLAAGNAIASLIPDEELTPNNIMPSVFDSRVAPAVSVAVQEVARSAGIARK